ncbi:protein LTO1 homolog [Argonauta hians]
MAVLVAVNMSVEKLCDNSEDGDIFDSVVMQEERCVAAAFSAGLRHGTEKGQQNGAELGRSMGCDVGNEVGFLNGFVSTWLTLLDNSPDTKPRIYRALTSLQSLLDKYQVGGVDNTCVSDLKMIQAKFKKVVSLLGIEVSWSSSSSSKQEDLSF